MWQGTTARSLPSTHSPGYNNAINRGFLFEFTKTKTYWSTISMMQSYVNGILIPYFRQEQHKLGLPETQPCIWQIDVWSVHTSQEFCSWMWMLHPWIILDYVPGGCTGLFQPCDVGMQRVLKQAITRAQSADLVDEVSNAIETGVQAYEIRIDTTLGTLHDHSVQWLLKAHEITNTTVLVKAISSFWPVPFRLQIYISCISLGVQKLLNRQFQSFSRVADLPSDVGSPHVITGHRPKVFC